MGEPLLNLPQDMFAIQDIIWCTRPEFVIEVGVARGGGMLFEATLLEVLGGHKVIGVDINIPPDWLSSREAVHPPKPWRKSENCFAARVKCP